MTFLLKLYLVAIVLWLILPTMFALVISVTQAVKDPMYKRLKTKGKIKYIISQLIEVEF